jgi:hypothetical protein
MNRRPTRLDDKLNTLLIAAAAIGACIIVVGNADGMAFGRDGRLAAAHATTSPVVATQHQQQVALLAAAP